MPARWNEVLLGAQLADVKESLYGNTLAVASLVELLIEKGVITAAEVAGKSEALDRAAEPTPRRSTGR